MLYSAQDRPQPALCSVASGETTMISSDGQRRVVPIECLSFSYFFIFSILKPSGFLAFFLQAGFTGLSLCDE
jgi:hypothetical protein